MEADKISRRVFKEASDAAVGENFSAQVQDHHVDVALGQLHADGKIRPLPQRQDLRLPPAGRTVFARLTEHAALDQVVHDLEHRRQTESQLGGKLLPKLFAYTPKFDIGAIVSVTLVFLVSAAETIGDTSAVCTGGLGREITEKEVSGSLACDGFISAVSGGVFGCPPITSFSQNVGLVAMTKVVNRFTIMFGALTLVLAGLFPPVGAFFSTLPDCVLGGCTVIMFGAIIVSGVTLLGECGFDRRNTIIAATSFAIGIGVTQVPEFFSGMPQLVSDIFANNPVAGVFVVAMVLSLTLPKKIKAEDVGALTEGTMESSKPEQE